jgi:nucleoside 2-deoxyribosyltransferase
MNIYFACAITGGREFEPVYQAIVNALLQDGHVVPTAALTKSGVADDEGALAPRYVYARDVKWLQKCNVLIAEVSVPSHGVGYEIGYALNANKPVICLYQQDCKVSKMITGNPDPKLTVQMYPTTDEAIAIVRNFVHERTINLEHL